MTTGIINNPAMIREYRGDISQRIEELINHEKETAGAIDTVSEGWKDVQFQQFQQNFSEDARKIGDLIKVLEQYRDEILGPLQQRMEGYLDESLIRTN